MSSRQNGKTIHADKNGNRYDAPVSEWHTQKEVADQLGISQSYISRLEKRIIRRLRRELEAVS